MTFPAHGSDGQISSVHCAALCKEMGERLGDSLDRQQVAMPPNLLMLIERLRDDAGKKPIASARFEL